MVFAYLKNSKKYSIKGENVAFIQALCCVWRLQAAGLEAALGHRSVMSDPDCPGHGYQGRLCEYCAVRLCLKMFLFNNNFDIPRLPFNLINEKKA